MAMSNNGNGSAGGEAIPSSASRYVLPPHPSQNMVDRRRRPMNKNGNYYNTGPRDRNNSGYRGDPRMNSRGMASGDGPHNYGQGCRGGGGSGGTHGHEFDVQQNMSAPERSTNHMHHQSHNNHQYHNQYSSQQQHHGQKNSEYDGGMSSRGGRGGGGSSTGGHHMGEHRSGGMHQNHHQDSHGHGQQHVPQSYVGGAGGHHGAVPTANDIIIVQPQQDHHFKPGNVAPNQGHFQQGGTAPQQIPAPAVGFIGYPNGQPAMMGTLVMCHIPLGINPASVIAPGVQTQVIGCGFMNPMVHFACAVPSQVVPSQPVIIQQPQQHYAPHPQPHYQPAMTVPPPQPTGAEEAAALYDTSGLLNPDAHAFFPTLTSFSEEVDEEEDIVVEVASPEEVEVQKVDLVKEDDVSVKDSPVANLEEVRVVGDSSGNGSDLINDPSLTVNED